MNEAFHRDGYYLARGIISPVIVHAWAAIYTSLIDPDRTPEHNPVAVNDERLQPLLSIIARNINLLDEARDIWGENIALYNQRFVVKDKHSRGAVMWHQDIGYHMGYPRKCSAFVALSRADECNGGLETVWQSHNYGYLGDTGEIDINMKPGPLIIRQHEMAPGDVLFVHSATWHASPAHVTGPDRILADIIYQPADDPSGRELMRGAWQTPNRFTDEMREKMFKWSRTSRLKDMQSKLDDHERTRTANP